MRDAEILVETIKLFNPFFKLGCRACALLLEQRVHNVPDGGEQSRDNADNVSGIVSHLEGALEPDDRFPRLQRPKDVHGDELEAVRRVDGQLQGGTTKVSSPANDEKS